MKFVHLSDLHLGKRVNEFSMLEDQKYILLKILQIIRSEKPDGVLIAGDIYDKSIPPAEAVQLFDEFLTRLAELGMQVFLISGNHDSAERIAFGSRLMDASGIHLCPVYDGSVSSYTMEDSFGPVNIYLLPFLKPAHVRRFFPDAAIETYTDALRTVINTIDLQQTQRNLVVTHQFVTGATRSESEDLTVGGMDNVDAEVFNAFDYVALGHIHGPQKISRDTVRYCGTPLKYSFSEVNHKKSVTIVELFEKGRVEIRTEELIPLRDLREIRGTWDQVTRKANYENTNTQDYMHVTLLDEEDIPDAAAKLRVIYPNLMKLDYDNRRTRSTRSLGTIDDIKARSPLELFAEFYENRNNQPMSDVQTEYMQALIEKLKEVE
ncbi:MAG: exonuclease SbcCD subunit D [Anaerovoracaceae bacterium]